MKKCGGYWVGMRAICPAHPVCERHTPKSSELEDNWIRPEWDDEKETCPNFIRVKEIV